LDELLNLFNMLSDKTRLRILLLLYERELCVCEIFEALNMSQPRVSRQLAILKQNRLIKDRREGKWIYYRIEENEYTEQLLNIIALFPDWLDDDREYNEDKRMLSKTLELKNRIENCKEDCNCQCEGGMKFEGQ
jgi:DNA-binding transcriptional ArsR family regulator